MFEEYLTNDCWKRDQSNTLPIDRKESKAIPTIITSLSLSKIMGVASGQRGPCISAKAAGKAAMCGRRV
ncbi:hypothetical protein [Yersinia aleksiciae]|uniref:hypothetical protein n=1 Tax=Yersinia aleksiciae TaxID=263819 RepID=UPI0008FF9749